MTLLALILNTSPDKKMTNPYSRFILIVLLSYLCCFFSHPSSAGSRTALKATEQTLHPISNKKIEESSGLACSTRDKHLLWTHNDSGHMAIIYAMNDKGRDLGTFHLDDIENQDWEDMDAFKYEGEHYLLIADTGDNLRMRMGSRISVIKEPLLGKKNQSTLSPIWSFTFQYENNDNFSGTESYDVESVAVDVVREKIILLTKRTSHALIYELPLRPVDTEQIQIAIKTGELKTIINPSALDISADGQLMSINTYRRIHRFHWVQGKKNWHYDDTISYKKLFQPEGMCLSKDKKNYFVSSERTAFLLKINMK